MESLSPCDLSSSHLDLSFENLCQELLALSASCTTLERLINQTDMSIDAGDGKESFTKERKKVTNGDIRITSSSSGNTSSHDQSIEDNSCHDSSPEIPPRNRSSFIAVQQIANQHFSQRSERFHTPSPPNHDTKANHSLETQANHISSLTVAPEKLQALTVDVGQSKTSKVAVPVKDGLITITSPQPCLFPDNDWSKTGQGLQNRNSMQPRGTVQNYHGCQAVRCTGSYGKQVSSCYILKCVS